MISILVDKDLDLIVGLDASTRRLSTDPPSQVAANVDEFLTARKDTKAKAVIMAAISGEAQALIGAENATTSQELWKLGN